MSTKLITHFAIGSQLIRGTKYLLIYCDVRMFCGHDHCLYLIALYLACSSQQIFKRNNLSRYHADYFSNKEQPHLVLMTNNDEKQ